MTAIEATPIPAAALYLRISKDDLGDELGVARQRKDCLRLVEDRGWRVFETYQDNDISASERSKKARPAFRRMMDAVRTGSVDVIVGWDLDRITRRPAEAEEMWKLLLDVGHVRVVTVSGDDVDLATGDGLLVARIKMAVAAEEIRKMSQRIRRKHLELAQDGKPVGLGAAQPFGYKPGGMEVNEDEAALLRRAGEDVLAGVPVTAIAREWNEQGVRSPFPRKTTNGWRAESVRALLVSPRPAGLRRHSPGNGPVVEYPAVWPAIIDRATHDRLVAALSAGRGKGAPRRRSLLTGLVRCGRCGEVMTRDSKDGRPYLRCRAGAGRPGCGRNGMAAEQVENAVVRRVFAHVEERAAAGVEAAMAAGMNDEAAQVATELAQAERFKLTLAEQMAVRGDFDDAELAVMRKANRDRIGVLRGRLEELTATSTMRRWDSLAAFEDEWMRSDTDRRWGLLRSIIDSVQVRPYEGRRGDLERVAVDFHK
ncbi:MAG: recombinase family protein [Actinomycetota bacterium]|nr:recombinase family protein [Actinomycetota bacterium]